MSAWSWLQVNGVTMWLWKTSQIQPSKRRAFPFFLCFSRPCSEWRDRGRGKRDREGEMERSWVMDALCVSVIPNYWTLPFKASLRCISHFCLSDWWRAGPDWGALCVLNTASLVIQYLLQIQYTAAAAPAPHPLLHCNFLDLYSFSCTVIECIVSLRSGLLWCDAKKNEITYRVFFVFFWVFKATKINRREQGVFRGRLHFDTEQRRCIHCLQLVLVAHTCIQSHLFRAYYLYGYWYLTFILRCWVGEQHRKHWKVM